MPAPTRTAMQPNVSQAADRSAAHFVVVVESDLTVEGRPQPDHRLPVRADDAQTAAELVTGMYPNVVVLRVEAASGMAARQ